MRSVKQTETDYGEQVEERFSEKVSFKLTVKHLNVIKLIIIRIIKRQFIRCSHMARVATRAPML